MKKSFDSRWGWLFTVWSETNTTVAGHTDGVFRLFTIAAA
jgi:hypothetical protein